MNRETFFKERTLELCFQCAGFDDSGAKISNKKRQKGKANFKLAFENDLGSWGNKTSVYE